MDLRLGEAALRRLSPRALMLMLRRRAEAREQEHRAADLRAGLIASQVYNAFRPKGAPAMAPDDWFKDEGDDDDSRYMSPEQTAAELKLWAASRNARLAASREVEPDVDPSP